MAYIFNGEVIEGEHVEISVSNRALNYGDGVFESMKYHFNRLNFWEDHYFRLMSSMRIMRMEIPMSFSPEYLEDQVMQCLIANDLKGSAARVRLLVYRRTGGKYTPEINDVDYIITVAPHTSESYHLNETGLHIDLFKDYYKQVGLLSNLKMIGCTLYTLASIYRKENDLDECILLNDRKEVVESTSANLFMVKGNKVYTAPLTAGCLKGVMRKQVLNILPKMGYEVVEEAFSPFELQKADEIFLSNASMGIQWVARYRRQNYDNNCSTKLVEKLNVHAALGVS